VLKLGVGPTRSLSLLRDHGFVNQVGAAPRNQTREPTPAVIPVGPLLRILLFGHDTSVVIEAILLALNSVNKRLFELPGRMIVGGLGVWKIVISTVGVTRATSETKALEIQMLPSGPAAMELENLPR